MTDTETGTVEAEPAAVVARRGAVRSLVVANALVSVGSGVTAFALPVLAILVLHVSAVTVTVVYVTSSAAQALASLPAGAVVDRHNPRQVIVASCVAGATAAGTVPCSAAFGAFDVWFLLICAVGVGTASTFAQVGVQAMAPMAVGGDSLTSANTSLTLGRSLGVLAGPGAGAALLTILTAGTTVLVDCAAQIVGAAALLAFVPIRLGSRPTVGKRPGTARKDLGTAFRVVGDDPVLTRVVVGPTLFNVGGGLVGSVYFLFAYRSLGLSTSGVGLAATCGYAGLLAGAKLAGPAIRRFGLGRASAWSAWSAVAALTLLPLATIGAPLVFLAAYETAFGATVSVFRVAMTNLRQARTPPGLHARVFSITLFGQQLGAPIGGLLATVLVRLSLGLTGTVVVGVLLCLASSAAYSSVPFRGIGAPDHKGPDAPDLNGGRTT